MTTSRPGHVTVVRPPRARWASETGAVLIELAFTLPMLLLVAAAIIDFGFLFQRYEIVTGGAREGVRIAITGNVPAAEVEDWVATYIQQAGLATSPGNPTTTVSPTTLSVGADTWPATSVTVSYDSDYAVLGPIAAMVGGSFGTATLQAQATMRIDSPGGVP